MLPWLISVITNTYGNNIGDADADAAPALAADAHTHYNVDIITDENSSSMISNDEIIRLQSTQGIRLMTRARIHKYTTHQQRGF
jgi:hypothetical protein